MISITGHNWPISGFTKLNLGFTLHKDVKKTWGATHHGFRFSSLIYIHGGLWAHLNVGRKGNHQMLGAAILQTKPKQNATYSVNSNVNSAVKKRRLTQVKCIFTFLKGGWPSTETHSNLTWRGWQISQSIGFQCSLHNSHKIGFKWYKVKLVFQWQGFFC